MANHPNNAKQAEQAILKAGWWIVIGLAIGPAVSNGFARFAYGLILPSMRSDLAWGFTAAGWINTANAIGYLLGALAALSLIKRVGAAILFNTGMVLIAISLIACSTTTDFAALTAWRIVAGIGGAPVFVAAGALASGLFRGDPHRNALAIAICLAGGGGVGMLISGLAIPAMLEHWGAAGWPTTWRALGIASAVLIPPSWLAVRHTQSGADNSSRASAPLKLQAVIPALAGYGLFGVGYIVYLTFLIAWMRDNGAGAGMVAFIWAALSAMVIVSPFLWQSALARARGGGAMAAASLATGMAILLPVCIPGNVSLIVSATLFGASFFIVPTAATSFSRKHFSQPQWGAAMAWFTVAFAAGQIIGPVAAGALADQAGDVAAGLWLGGIIMLAAAGTSWWQRPAPNHSYAGESK